MPNKFHYHFIVKNVVSDRRCNDKATRGEVLTDDEQLFLTDWYESQDKIEAGISHGNMKDMTERIFPHSPLEYIIKSVRERKILWTYHINMRLKSRGISREAIVSSFARYEIIEEYPDDKYFPSYPVYSRYRDVVFHILFAADVEGDNVRVITAYYPNSDEWENDFKTRRRR